MLAASEYRLMLASFSGQLSVVKELCYHGANKQLADYSGSTVLHWATDSGNAQLVEWLIDNGADINAVDVNRWTPLLRICTLPIRFFWRVFHPTQRTQRTQEST